jgi:hypothetical protein
MHGIHNYIPETSCSRVHSVAAALYLQFVLHVMLFPMFNILYFYISTFRCKFAAPSMAVFFSTLTSCFLGRLLKDCLNDSEKVPVAPIITGITDVCKFHIHCIYILEPSQLLLVSHFSLLHIYHTTKLHITEERIKSRRRFLLPISSSTVKKEHITPKSPNVSINLLYITVQQVLALSLTPAVGRK